METLAAFFWYGSMAGLALCCAGFLHQLLRRPADPANDHTDPPGDPPGNDHTELPAELQPAGRPAELQPAGCPAELQPAGRPAEVATV